MDLILRNARVAVVNDGNPVDIGIDGGRIAVIEPHLIAEGEELDVGGRLVGPGFIETHIHLDKSCILERCKSEKGHLDEAIEQVALAKKGFTAEDCHDRAVRTLEKSLLHGTTHMRTHLEVDPVVGLRSLEGLMPLIDEYKWAIDLEICVFPQEGLLNNPGTDELMVESLKRGCRVVGAAPYTDSDPRGQIDRVFEMAREFDVDIDMHLDFGPTHDELDIPYVCELTDKFDYGGRVAVGHVTKLSTMPPEKFQRLLKPLADSGVAVTVLPSTDLFLMGRHMDHNIMRGVVPVHTMLDSGVNCSLSSNNVLNPFTPFGDCSLIRMANLYANICHVGKRDDVLECFNMVTERSARLIRLDDYGVAVGNSADMVVHDCTDAATAVAELIPPIYGFKRGRRTFTREPAALHRPH
ncbi:MAG: amidohydrolase family protein [Alphaproteobacteria bacterium]|nr:amidohydrolase family protein [Alphaproteobacteria bacterium]